MLCFTKTQYYKENTNSLHEDIIQYRIHIYDETNKNDLIDLKSITVNRAKNILLFLNRKNSYFYLKNIDDDRFYNLNKEEIDQILQLNKHRGSNFFSNTVRYNLLLNCLKDIEEGVCYKNTINQGYGFLCANKNNYFAKVRKILPTVR